MPTRRTNRISGGALLVLSLIALFTVLSGYSQPRQTDEGAAAHIFQLTIVLSVPALLLFLVTANWRNLRSLRPLLVSIALLVFAFAALYYLEH